MNERLTYIFGHKNPDTDSVCAAIALSYLKNKQGFNTEARILGHPNNETKFVLNYFNVEHPKYLNDARLQIKDVNFKKNFFIQEHCSLLECYNAMIENSASGIPIVDSNQKLLGIVTLKEIAKEKNEVRNLEQLKFAQLREAYTRI